MPHDRVADEVGQDLIHVSEAASSPQRADEGLASIGQRGVQWIALLLRLHVFLHLQEAPHEKTVATAPRGQVHSAHETPTVCLDMLQHVGTRRGGVGEEKGEEGTLRLLPVTIQAQIDASAVTAARAAPARAGEHTQGNGAGTSACKWCNLPGRSGGQLGIAAARPRRQKLAAVLLGHRIFVLARFPPLRSQQMLSGLDEATPHELTSQSSAETFIGDLLPSTTGARFRR
mmetsp:Transcript_14929/g.52413  ORF Transcript_14929/g.52413 Transcript_14929/m.52413 type:complete len:230 (+) Transcript_14929:383-1072(+)